MLSALFFLLLQTNLFFSVESACLNNGNYTANGTYAENLNAALSSLPTNIGNDGFYSTSVSRRAYFGSPDRSRVYAIALCRGDAQLDQCRACIRNITSDIRTSCPNQRQAVDWRDYCTLRYSNEYMLGVMATRPSIVMWDTQNATNLYFSQIDVRSHLDNLREQAADSMRKVAAGNITATDFQYIFAMVQCSPDLSAYDCRRCLISAADQIPTCCDRRRGGRVMYPSCSLRYEIYEFYNQTRLLELSAAPVPQTLAQPPPPPPPPPPPGNNTTQTIIIVVLSVVAVCVILSVSIYAFLRKRMKRKPEEIREILEAIDEMSATESLKYDLSAIRAATNDFSEDNKLGRGGFGVVYRGKLSNGQEIAVKRLSFDSGQGGVEFKNEVLLLAKLQHRNLVRLLGFCLERTEKLLIYEFVQNASLDHFIFDKTKRTLLDWEKRYKIIGGIARGILYLHEDSQLRIIHRDLKPSNVLLDGAMNPKIADFGMARLFGQDETQGSTTKIAGTFGYMAPEYVMHGQFSIKSDVFSFGVLVLEIIIGQKSNGLRRGENAEDLLSLTWKNWHEGTITRIVDQCLGSNPDSISHMQRCVHIGLLCVQERASDRPTMASVVLMLNSSSLTLASPTKPAFYMPRDNVSDTSLLQEHISIEYGSSSIISIPDQPENISRNDASFTDLCPR